ncbi:unnamed protein product [Thlaspi arvense]|uniref:Uncharacterized protein n=1 Tax=Thlaspi arvense TaxID=13288 RepID=A0AAU9R8X5_THLAR|nr:unnamed protein product [Thlaspi arvense]
MKFMGEENTVANRVTELTEEPTWIVIVISEQGLKILRNTSPEKLTYLGLHCRIRETWLCLPQCYQEARATAGADGDDDDDLDLFDGKSEERYQVD